MSGSKRGVSKAIKRKLKLRNLVASARSFEV
jgi:hypothetical protein